MKPGNRPKKKSRAQAMVEFALVLPILLLVVYGMLEAGRFIFIYSTVITGSREATRYGSANGLSEAGNFPYEECDQIRAAAHKVDVLGAIQDVDIARVNQSVEGPLPSDIFTQAYNAGDGYGTYCTGATDNVVPPLDTGARFVVRVCGEFLPILPVFLPYTERSCSAGTGLVFTNARTILGTITIPVDPPVPQPKLELSKIASPEIYDAAGEVITYTYTFRNVGTKPLTGPYAISDDHDMDDDDPSQVVTENFTCTGPSTLEVTGVNSSFTCTHTFTIDQNDLDDDHVSNCAVGSARDGILTVYSASCEGQALETVHADQTPELNLQKSANPTAVGLVGEQVTYTYTLQNTGNVTLTSPYSVDDDKVVSGVNCSGAVSPLNPGASTTCTATYTITQADLNAGSVTNTATATAMFSGDPDPVESNPDSATVLTTTFLLQVAPAPTIVNTLGQQITYTYTLRNMGDEPLSAPYAVTDDKITGIVCTQTPATLNPGATTTCSATYNVTQDDLDAGSIVNNATATSNGGTVTSNPAMGLVTVTQTLQFALNITPNPTTATTLGQTVTYSYTFQNTGNVRIKKPYVVSDDTYTGVNCTAAVSPLNPGASTACTLSHAITQADLDAGSITNTATATARYGPSSTLVTSNQDSATVITHNAPRLTLIKEPNPTVVAGAGHLITYTYKLRNTGNVTLTSPYTVSDDKVASVNCSGALSPLNLGQETTCTGQYTTQPADVTVGSVTNHATATAWAGSQQISDDVVATVTIDITICDVRHGPLQASSSGITMPIYNFSSFDVEIIQIIVDWNRYPSTQRLTSILLDSTSLWTGEAATSPTTIILGSGSGATINPVVPRALNIEFQEDYTDSGTERLRIYFSPSGCGILDSEDGTQAP